MYKSFSKYRLDILPKIETYNKDSVSFTSKQSIYFISKCRTLIFVAVIDSNLKYFVACYDFYFSVFKYQFKK